MQSAAHRAAGFRLAAEPLYDILQFTRAARAVFCPRDEERLELRIVRIFGRLAKATLTVLRCFDQFVQYTRHVGRHLQSSGFRGSSNPLPAAATHLLSRMPRAWNARPLTYRRGCQKRSLVPCTCGLGMYGF